jgi:hypothetical protein
MALDYSNFGTVGSTPDNPAGTQLGNLSQLQSMISPQIGAQAAAYADPFAPQRAQYQKQLSDYIGNTNAGAAPWLQQLSTLTSNPGSQDTSPYYKYLMDTEMNKVNAANAAHGLINSGAGQTALQDRAAGVASQAYGQQAGILSNAAQVANQNYGTQAGVLGGLAGATTSNPGAAGSAYANFMARSQNQAQQAVAQKNAPAPTAPLSSVGAGTGLPSGGMNYTGGNPLIAPMSSNYGDYYGGQNPSAMTNAQLDAAMGNSRLSDLSAYYNSQNPNAATTGTTTDYNSPDYTSQLYGSPIQSNSSWPGFDAYGGSTGYGTSDYYGNGGGTDYLNNYFSDYSQPNDYTQNYAIDPYSYDQNYG